MRDHLHVMDGHPADHRPAHGGGPGAPPPDGASAPVGDGISHSHARALAELWRDPDDRRCPLGLLAGTGAVTSATVDLLCADLAALDEAAALSADAGRTICQVQVAALLGYARRHGPRAAVDGWNAIPDDGTFVRATRAFARARQPRLRPAARTFPPPPRDGLPRAPALTLTRAAGGTGSAGGTASTATRRTPTPDRTAASDGGPRDTSEPARLAPAPRPVDGPPTTTPGREAPPMPAGAAADARHAAPPASRLDARQRPAHRLDAPPAPDQDAAALREQIGGAGALAAAARRYAQRVAADPVLGRHVDHMGGARLAAHQRAVLCAVAGTPAQWCQDTAARQRLRDAHEHLGITAEARDRVADHLQATLRDLGADPAMAARAAGALRDLAAAITGPADPRQLVAPPPRPVTEEPPPHPAAAIGGPPALRAAVDVLARRLACDPAMVHHFASMPPARVAAHQRAVLTAGAHDPAHAQRLADVHRDLRLSAAEYDALVAHVVETLLALEATPDEVETVTLPVLARRAAVVQP